MQQIKLLIEWNLSTEIIQLLNLFLAYFLFSGKGGLCTRFAKFPVGKEGCQKLIDKSINCSIFVLNL